MSAQPAGHRVPSASSRLTAAEVSARPLNEPGLAERLYQPTNELRFSFPIVGVSGRCGDEVYYQRGTKCFVRRYVVPRPPDTPKQLEQQSRIGEVMPAWSRLPTEVRNAWLNYSLTHFGRHQHGKKTGNLGQNLFTSAQLNRLAWGDNLSSAGPSAPPPPRPIQAVEVPAPEGQMAWRVDHALKLPAGYRLEVRTTPAAKQGRPPRPCLLVRAGQTTAESFFPLAESGTVYLLPNPVHSVEPDQRYGLQIKLISPDGIEGRPLYLDLTRKAPGTLPADEVSGTGLKMNEYPNTSLDGKVSADLPRSSRSTAHLKPAGHSAGQGNAVPLIAIECVRNGRMPAPEDAVNECRLFRRPEHRK